MRITEGGNIGIGTSSPNDYGAGFVNLQINSTTGGIIQATYGGTTAIAEILTTSGEGRFGTRTNHPMILKTNNTERMRIDSSGHVGIGTTAPESFGGGHKTLEVSGSSNAHGGVFKTATSDSAGAGSTGTEMLMYTTSSGGTIAVTSADPLLFQTSSIERMRINSAGSVGIGATGNYTLTVGPQGGAGHSIVQLVNATTGTTAANGAYISVLGGQSDMRVWQLGNANILVGTNAAERMRISANGNIGIGGTPAEKLDIIAPDNSSIIMARVTRSSKDYGIALENNGGTGHSTINAFGSGAALIFETNGTERTRITSGGTLAVGTTAGLNSELIHARRSSGTISTLYNSGATGDVLRLYHENTAVTAFSIWGGGAQRGFITSPVSSNGLIFGTSSTERMRITSGGIVGIGAAPISSARLEVFANNTSTHSFFRGDNHGVRFGFSASESLIDSVTATISDYAPLQINAKTSLTLTLNSATVVALATSGMTVTGTAVATQGMPIVTNSANTKTLALGDSGSYIRFSNTTITVLTIPTNATVAFPTGAEVTGTGVANTVSIANSAGVTLNSKESLVTASAGGAFFLKKVGTNEWDLHGALE
jgi:hypothetical protein